MIVLPEGDRIICKASWSGRRRILPNKMMKIFSGSVIFDEHTRAQWKRSFGVNDEVGKFTPRYIIDIRQVVLA